MLCLTEALLLLYPNVLMLSSDKHLAKLEAMNTPDDKQHSYETNYKALLSEFTTSQGNSVVNIHL